MRVRIALTAPCACGEMADAAGLGPVELITLGGSSPLVRTNNQVSRCGEVVSRVHGKNESWVRFPASAPGEYG